MSNMERIKHLASGGFWHASDGEWVQAGHGLRKIWHDHPKIQRHLGWVSHASVPSGMISLQYDAQPFTIDRPCETGKP